ncbi:xanthine dehydrogenase family protein molybdopterin-binding subunit [Kitasatospora sp. NPDC058162]|uniref:xanthine dehydrogenase family protein molybdopterin-binding subunit n=1 Tax=Kitasatospora sp. NPDC058162 TaxID=3346362 RepID=UPI0036D8960E
MTTRHSHTRDRAAGLARYVLDDQPQDGLFARLVRARGPHSEVVLDSAAALAVPGVALVLTPDDDPGIRFSTNPHGSRDDTSVFTREARFPGDVVGVVVARSRAAARAGAAAVTVHERPLPAVLDPATSLDPSSPAAHRDHPGNELARFAMGCDEADLDRALAGSAHVFEHTSRIDAGPHHFLEPVAAVARWDEGRCLVRSASQCPGLSRALLARLLGVDPADVHYEPVTIGGSFGGKEEFLLDAVAALCSRAAGGRPVTVETDRREMTTAFRVRHAATVRVVTGVDTDGRILARHIDAVFEGGPYAGHSPSVTANGLALALTLYPAPATRATGVCVSLNRVPSGAFRGYGAPQVLFAVESQLDVIGRRLGIDPVTLRERNALRTGDPDPLHGWPVRSFGLSPCLRAVPVPRPPSGPADAPGPASGGRLRRGTGIAALVNLSGLTGVIGTDRAEAGCRIERGRVVVLTACPDVGQGIHTVLTSVAAERLGVPPELVDVELDLGQADAGLFASRGSYLTAGAVAEAAAELLRRAREVSPDGLLGPDGRLRAGLEGLAAGGAFAAPDNALVAGAQAAEVEVDCATGVIRVLRVVSAHDTGRVLQRAQAGEQVRGGVLQAVGMALTEGVRFTPDGAVEQTSLLAQGVPRPPWRIPVEVHLIEEPHPVGPLGAKGLGESPVMGIVPAIANAVRDATGAELDHAPFTPERVLAALRASPDPTVRAWAGDTFPPSDVPPSD